MAGPLSLPSQTNHDTIYINTTLYSHHSHFIKLLKIDLTEGSETSANINQTPGKHPKVDTLNTEHGESLKPRTEAASEPVWVAHKAGVCNRTNLRLTHANYYTKPLQHISSPLQFYVSI
jgi:hypothetical protein